jgi:hypothetical protein
MESTSMIWWVQQWTDVQAKNEVTEWQATNVAPADE